MSYMAQGLATGLVVGSSIYFLTKSNILTQYDITSRELSRFNLAINPKHVVDDYKVQQIKSQRDWVVSPPNSTQQSAGRMPSEAWNNHLAWIYSKFATSMYNNKPPTQ